MNGVYIFDDKNDFIRVIEDLNKCYNLNNYKLDLTKELYHIQAVRNEIDFLNKCKIKSFSGFKTNKIIKVNLTTSDNSNYLITYMFRNLHYYDDFRRYLRKRELKEHY